MAYTYTITSDAEPGRTFTVEGDFGVKDALLRASIECPGLGHLANVTRRRGRGRKEDLGLHATWQKALPSKSRRRWA